MYITWVSNGVHLYQFWAAMLRMVNKYPAIRFWRLFGHRYTALPDTSRKPGSSQVIRPETFQTPLVESLSGVWLQERDPDWRDGFI